MPDDILGIFRKPFAEQVAALRLRFGDLRPTARWDDLVGAEHDRAFMVAGAVKADLLSDLAAAVDRAVAEGATLDQFRRDFRQIVERHGWHGWTGEGTKKGEAWRTRVIYRTNIATSYAAGRMAQLREAGFPFWVYRHSGAEHPRLDHLSWDGLVLPADHPFWVKHYPPNGWGCGCRVAGARSERGARRVGGDPDKPLPPGWDKTDPKTGTPPGIGKGWDHAPGMTVSDTVAALAQKLDALPVGPSIDLIQDWLKMPAFAAWFEDPTGSFPLVRIAPAEAEQIGAKTKIAVLSAETALKQQREHPELLIREYVLAQRVVDEADEVIQDGPTSLIFLHQPADDNGHLLVVRATVSGEGLFVTSFRRISADPAVRERLLRQLKRREKGGDGGE